MFTMVSGGVKAGMVPYLADQPGYDFIVGTGAAIHGHVMGPEAGATASRQSTGGAVEGVNIRDAAKKQRERDVALKIWGVYGMDDYSELYEIEA
jgi:ribulose 1,5-bisphosphate carboxylase large subunit-like protein